MQPRVGDNSADNAGPTFSNRLTLSITLAVSHEQRLIHVENEGREEPDNLNKVRSRYCCRLRQKRSSNGPRTHPHSLCALPEVGSPRLPHPCDHI